MAITTSKARIQIEKSHLSLNVLQINGVYHTLVTCKTSHGFLQHPQLKGILQEYGLEKWIPIVKCTYFNNFYDECFRS